MDTRNFGVSHEPREAGNETDLKARRLCYELFEKRYK